MKMTRLVAALASACALSAHAGPSSVTGAGVYSCGKYLAFRAEWARTGAALPNLQFQAWAEGYMSGLNTAITLMKGQAMKAIPDGDSLLYSLENECRKDPLILVQLAALNVYMALSEQIPVKK